MNEPSAHARVRDRHERTLAHARTRTRLRARVSVCTRTGTLHARTGACKCMHARNELARAHRCMRIKRPSTGACTRTNACAAAHVVLARSFIFLFKCVELTPGDHLKAKTKYKKRTKGVRNNKGSCHFRQWGVFVYWSCSWITRGHFARRRKKRAKNYGPGRRS